MIIFEDEDKINTNTNTTKEKILLKKFSNFKNTNGMTKTLCVAPISLIKPFKKADAEMYLKSLNDKGQKFILPTLSVLNFLKQKRFVLPSGWFIIKDELNQDEYKKFNFSLNIIGSLKDNENCLVLPIQLV